jgi:hypothetical protein
MARTARFLTAAAACMTSLLSTVPMSLYAASNDDVSRLEQVIAVQQKKLTEQEQMLHKQQLLLVALSEKVNALLAKPEVKKPSQGQVGVRIENTGELTQAGSNMILAEASTPEYITTIPKHRLVIGSQRANISVDGQVDMLGFNADDSDYNRVYFATNSGSPNKLNVDSLYQFDDDLTIGSQLQLGLYVNPSNSITQANPASSRIDIRRAEIYLFSKNWGAVWLGQGETASENTSHVDLSPTKVVGRAPVQDVGGGLYFNNSSASPQVKNVFNSLDGLGRKVRLRYNTPSFYGFSLATSASSSSREDVALRYGAKLGESKLAAELAYTTPVSVGTNGQLARGNELNGSFSVLFPVGLSVTGSGGELMASNAGRQHPYFFYLKPGYQFKPSRYGLTAFSVDYGRYKAFDQGADMATAYGAQALQNFDDLDLGLYAAYRQFELKRSGSDFHPIHLFMLGAIYRF